MAGMVVAVAVLLIGMTAASQAWLDVLRREQEAEMIFRAQEIARALLRFQRDQGRLPTKLEELLEPGSKGQYFLRREYPDPLVRDGKWGLLYAAPGGGILDPNAPGVGPDELGDTSRRPTTDPLGGLTSRFGEGPREVEGLPIVGVKSLCTDKPFRVYKGLSDYSQWTFTIYDLQSARAGQPGQPGQPAGQGNPRTPRRPGGRRP